MRRGNLGLWFVPIACLFGLCLNMISGCHPKAGPAGEPLMVRRVVVAGFWPALPPSAEPGMFRNSLSGSVSFAEPVSSQVAEALTQALFDNLIQDKRYELISPGQAKGVLSDLMDKDRKVERGLGSLLQEVGRNFGCDAILAGFVTQWQEREGTEYAVRRAASVAYDLCLLRPSDGTIIWKGSYRKTQRSLSEDLFDYETFIESKGQWVNAETLAGFGLRRVLSEMPGAAKKE